MHDEQLSRTTDVASVFPARITAHSSDFSWAELQRLNAGAWFLEVRTPAVVFREGRVHSMETHLLGQSLPSGHSHLVRKRA
jgi:hypothetical protein